MLREVLNDWKKEIDEFLQRTQEIKEDESALPLAEGKWSRKEVIGHLIDSASNNHQRFVRAQFESDLSLPAYQQQNWIDANGYRRRNWTELLELWSAYNRQLIHLAALIPEDKLSNTCRVGESEPLSLKFLITDYVRHLKHHLRQMTS